MSQSSPSAFARSLSIHVAGALAAFAILEAILIQAGLGERFPAFYSTSNIIHEYNTTQHVAAALSLFASIALLFFYILRFVLAFGRD